MKSVQHVIAGKPWTSFCMRILKPWEMMLKMRNGNVFSENWEDRSVLVVIHQDTIDKTEFSMKEMGVFSSVEGLAGAPPPIPSICMRLGNI